MSLAPVPDGGAQHPDAGDGAAFNGEVGRHLADRVIEAIRRQPGVATICDLGCGNGHLAGRLGRLGFTVIGIDASPAYIDMARAHHGSERVTFLARLVDHHLAGELATSHPPFDLVVASEVIEHLYDPLQFLQAACSMLRPGGTAVFSTPYHGYLKNVAISALNQWDLHHGVHWLGGHIKFFSVPSLRGMLIEAGFSDVRFSFCGRFPGFWKNMIAVATKADPNLAGGAGVSA